jgi:hypothetical protein
MRLCIIETSQMKFTESTPRGIEAITLYSQIIKFSIISKFRDCCLVTSVRSPEICFYKSELNNQTSEQSSGYG